MVSIRSSKLRASFSSVPSWFESLADTNPRSNSSLYHPSPVLRDRALLVGPRSPSSEGWIANGREPSVLFVALVLERCQPELFTPQRRSSPSLSSRLCSPRRTLWIESLAIFMKWNLLYTILLSANGIISLAVLTNAGLMSVAIGLD